MESRRQLMELRRQLMELRKKNKKGRGGEPLPFFVILRLISRPFGRLVF